MEDCDWTDLPSNSDGLEGQATQASFKDNLITDSSPEINDQKQDPPVFKRENKNKNTGNDDTTGSEMKFKDVKKTSFQKQEESCPICLSSFEDRSFLDQCFHSFCFCCILQWCEVVQTCPLCKAGFASVIHNVKSMQDYEQYVIEKKKESECPSNNTYHVELSYDEHGFDEHGQRFRYRTTRTLRNVAVNNNERSNIRRRPENTSRRSEDQWGNEARSRRRSRHTRARIRGIEKRRQVYAFNLRATSTLGRGRQRSRNISSQFYKTYQGCTHRLIPWLSRDLKVLLGDNEEEVNFLMEFILTLITRIDMDSVDFLEELRPFLLQTTGHFVHELLSFAKSPFDMATYDDCVVYPWPDENSSAANRHNEDDINHESGGNLQPVVTSQAVTARTTLSQCEWSDTPAGLHRVFHVEDSPVLNDESERQHHQVVEISDSTDSSVRMDDGTRSPPHEQLPEKYILHTEEVPRSQSREDGCQLTCASVIPGTSLKTVQRNSMERKDIPTSSRQNIDGEKQIHRHIHNHIHKHRHKHRHKHEHKHEHRHAHKRKHRRRHFSPEPRSTSEDSSFVNKASSYVSQATIDISAPQALVSPSGMEVEINIVEKAHSPTVEEMRKEIDELNVQIQQHEEQLYRLTRRTEA